MGLLAFWLNEEFDNCHYVEDRSIRHILLFIDSAALIVRWTNILSPKDLFEFMNFGHCNNSSDSTCSYAYHACRKLHCCICLGVDLYMWNLFSVHNRMLFSSVGTYIWSLSILNPFYFFHLALACLCSMINSVSSIWYQVLARKNSISWHW